MGVLWVEKLARFVHFQRKKVYKNKIDVKIKLYKTHIHQKIFYRHIQNQNQPIKMPKCQFENCSSNAYFNFRGEPKGRFCKSHITDNTMVNVVDKLCETEGCNKRALFGVIIDGKPTKPTLCNLHKLPNYVNVKAKRCAEPGCFTIPIYNMEGEKLGKWCIEHKPENTVNVINVKCIHEGCKTTAHFNFAGETVGLYCSKHVQTGMEDIKHHRCDYGGEGGCNKAPSFKFENETKCRRCREHILEGMTDGKHRKCIEEGCDKVPSFGNGEDEIALYCGEHKPNGGLDLVHRKCEFEGCVKRPLFNVEGSKRGRFCSDHRSSIMINVVNIKCKSEWCYVIVHNNYEGYCYNCFVHLFPEKPVSRNYKTKERDVVQFILGKFPDYSWTFDKTVAGGCSKRRPDVLLDLGTHVLIIEIDENQHTDYDCSCENKRLMELSQDVGHRPLILIRFNPDDYICKNGTTVNSCWISKNGKTNICKKYENLWKNRLNSLFESIKYWIENKSDKTIEIIQLYYDGCDV